MDEVEPADLYDHVPHCFLLFNGRFNRGQLQILMLKFSIAFDTNLYNVLCYSQTRIEVSHSVIILHTTAFCINLFI